MTGGAGLRHRLRHRLRWFVRHGAGRLTLRAGVATGSSLARIMFNFDGRTDPFPLYERLRNAGASTVLMKVWPVLPSLPATGTLRRVASVVSAGISAARLGVKLP